MWRGVDLSEIEDYWPITFTVTTERHYPETTKDVYEITDDDIIEERVDSSGPAAPIKRAKSIASRLQKIQESYMQESPHSQIYMLYTCDGEVTAVGPFHDWDLAKRYQDGFQDREDLSTTDDDTECTVIGIVTGAYKFGPNVIVRPPCGIVDAEPTANTKDNQ